MSVSYTSGTRKQEFPHQDQRKSAQITNLHPSTFTPAFWDSLSRVWLTRRALREFDRRNRLQKALSHPSKSPSPSPSPLSPLPPVTQKHLEEISQIAKSGGFDLTDLRGYQGATEHGPTNDGSASGTRQSRTTTTKTKNSGPRDKNFDVKLSDIGVFYDDNLIPGAGIIPKPINFAELQERARRRRPSLSPSRFTDADHEAFMQIYSTSRTEEDIMKNIIPLIEGTSQQRGRSCANRPFNNLRPLAPDMVCGTPDNCYGANPADIESEVQRELGKLILPSTMEDMPVAPNFFLEVKSRSGTPMVADRQALHTGALGERGQIALRAWRRDGSGLDKMAHSITSTYYNGMIEFFSIHAENSRIHDNRTDYYMNSFFSVLIKNDTDDFRRGASAYRNLRDFAAEQRSESIALANSMVQRTGDLEE